MTVTLALDAMGGDKGPLMVLSGAEMALKKNPALNFLLYGCVDTLEEGIKNLPFMAHNLNKKIRIIPTTEVVTNDMKLTAALRARNSSMWQAVKSVADEETQAVVSAGNTGAYMALSKILLKSLDGVDRPAIPAVIPSFNKPIIMLDLGANLECSPENLVQFSLMGEEFARQLLGVQNPTIGLLNVGKEELKGHAELHKAAYMLRAIPEINFHGFVEGDDIAKGTVDVVVTDGFSGNISLKTMEGTATLIRNYLHEALSSTWRGKLGFLVAKPAFDRLRKQFDPRLYNGAVFLGLKKIAVKSHGGTDPVGFANAIGVAARMVEHNFSAHVQQRVDLLKNNTASDIELKPTKAMV